MGKQWKQAGKVEAANKKGAIISKLVKEITVAARLGGGDQESNSRLRMAINEARSQSVPKDTIERAIKKGCGELEGQAIEEITYEGYGPHQVAVIAICQTDNRNRTASDIRYLFKKHDGNLGEVGSVSWMFDKVSIVKGTLLKDSFDPEEEAIEVEANEVEKHENGVCEFFGQPEDLDTIQKNLLARGWDVKSADLGFKPKNLAEVSDENFGDVEQFLNALDDNEDVSKIYTNL